MRRLLPAAGVFISAAVISVAAQESVDRVMVGRIRQEGLERSRAATLYLTLADTIGARLTASPAFTQAARWARDRFAEWGLANAAPGAVRIRPRVVAREDLARDDGPPLYAVDRVRRRLDAVDRAEC